MKGHRSRFKRFPFTVRVFTVRGNPIDSRAGKRPRSLSEKGTTGMVCKNFA